MTEVFGFQVPTSEFYLHRGHAWAVVESPERVRVGLDDFSQKILGPADRWKLPEVGKVFYQDHICLTQFRQEHKAPFLAPVDGVIESVNPKISQKPGLAHDDPYGEGWLFLVKPNNLPRNLENLLYGEANAAWIDQESHRLLHLMESKVGVTLPSGAPSSMTSMAIIRNWAGAPWCRTFSCRSWPGAGSKRADGRKTRGIMKN
jgi:glycine cleavage system H lipoate-binding protein